MKASKNHKKRVELFRKFSNNFQKAREVIPLVAEKPLPDNKFLYVCPLCFKVFNEGALNQGSNYSLTIEHVPSYSLQGKGILLTCKECNNEAGSKLDKKLLDFEAVEEFNQKSLGSKIKAFVEINNELKSSALISNLEGGVHFKLNINRDEPRDKKLQSILGKGRLPSTVQISFKYNQPDKRIVLISHLRIAYLLAFSRLGYAYILSNGLEKIRHQILDPNKILLPEFGSINPINYEFKREGIYLVTTPKELKSLLVVFKMRTSLSLKFQCVMLPLPYEDAFDFYQKVLLRNSNLTKITCINLDPNFDYLENFREALKILSK
ncbi:MAG: hypothetical protein JNJ65_13995 [Cyclobacteriaceae bacterium]|nr:hypothetical protein [Cyclobacteriaceae bacterium]